MIDLLIHACDILRVEKNRVWVDVRQDIAIEGERISAVKPTREEPPPAKEVIQASGLLAIPGLMNTHAHVPMVLFRGMVEDVTVTSWFNDHIWPLESNLTAEDVLHKSIVVSCDTYYYGVAHGMGIENIHRFLSQFGFGKRTGIDIDGEAGGLLPSEQWKMKRFQQKWFPGDTISVGIGQGYNLATPMQLANATSVLANRVVVFRPHLVRQIQNSQTNELRSMEVEPIGHIELKAENLQQITDAMVDVLKPGGTAAVAGAGAEYRIAGKTGTAQTTRFLASVGMPL